MSKFIEKLKRVSEGEAQPLGFGIRAATRTPQMVLGAIVAKDDIGIVAGAFEKGADVLLISMPSVTEGLSELGRVSQLAADVPWGVWLESMTPEEVKQVRETGCDFIV